MRIPQLKHVNDKTKQDSIPCQQYQALKKTMMYKIRYIPKSVLCLIANMSDLAHVLFLY